LNSSCKGVARFPINIKIKELQMNFVVFQK
jgi:hypothetical protein